MVIQSYRCLGFPLRLLQGPGGHVLHELALRLLHDRNLQGRWSEQTDTDLWRKGTERAQNGDDGAE